MPTAISLFSGIGGLDLAAALAGFDIRAQVEIDPFCRGVLRRHAATYWPRAKHFTDVRYFGRNHIATPIDLIFGGFPCQDISAANYYASGLAGARSGLWVEFARIVSEIRPPFVVLENVPAITAAGRGGTEVIARLTHLGYDARWGVISAADADYPHARARWWCVAHTARFRHDGARCASEHQQDDQRPVAGDTDEWRHISGAPLADGQVGDTLRPRLEGDEYAQPLTAESSAWQPQSRMGRSVDGLPRWMARRVAGSNEAQHAWEAPRTYHKTNAPWHKDALRALGNAVVPAVAYPIFQQVYGQLTGARAQPT